MKSYKEAGVNIEEGYEAVKLIRKLAEKTFSENVLSGIGSFGAFFEIGEGYKNPVLVSGTDGVGTKLEIAFRLNKYDTVGIDCVAMCVNDILCHGARPLYFLDYLACGKLDSKIAADIVKGVSDGCLMSGCSLVGGETAEMPGFYKEGEYDIAGFCTGIVDKDKIIDGSKIEKGDVLIGIESSGAHSNGFSLIRKMITNLDEEFMGKKIGEVLLEPTRIYVQPIMKLMETVEIKGMSHITGGGFIENIPRMFSDKKHTAVIKEDSFEIHPVFKKLMQSGLDKSEMFNTFNMGIGFVICVKKDDVNTSLKSLNEDGYKTYEIGFVDDTGERICIK